MSTCRSCRAKPCVPSAGVAPGGAPAAPRGSVGTGPELYGIPGDSDKSAVGQSSGGCGWGDIVVVAGRVVAVVEAVTFVGPVVITTGATWGGIAGT